MINPSDLIALAHKLQFLEYSGQAWLKVKSQFTGAVGKDSADHVVDCIAQLRAENTRLRKELADERQELKDDRYNRHAPQSHE